MLTARQSLFCAALTAGVFVLASVAAAPTSSIPRDTIPDRLADSTFWRMVTEFSEPSGYFPSENFVSNETEWQYVIPASLKRVHAGGVYMGVGPEQNFTYMAAFHPRIAFICDIRRQNLVEHLMYKALIEMSRDRAGFLSMLWSRPRPDGLDSASPPAAMLAAFRNAAPDSLLYSFNLAAVFARLVDQHKFALTTDDSATLRAVYHVFYTDGPEVNYLSRSVLGPPRGGFGPGPGAGRLTFGPGALSGSGLISISAGGSSKTYTFTTDSLKHMVVMRDSAGTMVRDTTLKWGTMPGIGTNLPLLRPPLNTGYASFAELMTEDDGAGVNRGWLASETAFQWLKDFESRNLVVPVVGDFGGPKALRAVAGYLKANDAHVTTFYTSNVEQYLFQNGVDASFYENVAQLPTDANGIFIRSFPSYGRGGVIPRTPGSRLTQTTSSIDAVVRAFKAGTLVMYDDLAALQDR